MAKTSRTPSRFSQSLIAALSLAGTLVSLYVFLFQTGKVKTLVCPVFGGGCETVVTSPKAYVLRLPNSLLGMAGYSVLFGLSVIGIREDKKRRQGSAKTILAVSSFSVIVSILATYEQTLKLKTWCFWCLSSAAISWCIFLLSLLPFFKKRTNF